MKKDFLILCFIKEHIFAGSGDDGKEIITGHFGYLIRIAAGTVYQVPAADLLSGRGSDGEAICFPGDSTNSKIAVQFHPVIHGVADGADG